MTQVVDITLTFSNEIFADWFNDIIILLVTQWESDKMIL